MSVSVSVELRRQVRDTLREPMRLLPYGRRSVGCDLRTGTHPGAILWWRKHIPESLSGLSYMQSLQIGPDLGDRSNDED